MKTAIDLTAGDFGKKVRFTIPEFGVVVGELIEFGVPDDHPSLWTNPITAIEIKLQSQSGARFAFEVEPTTEIHVHEPADDNPAQTHHQEAEHG